VKDGETVLDSVRALYVWEWAHYPQYYIPKADVRTDAFVEGRLAAIKETGDFAQVDAFEWRAAAHVQRLTCNGSRSRSCEQGCSPSGP
jgi:Domain of unknown function (DUF427)